MKRLYLILGFAVFLLSSTALSAGEIEDRVDSLFMLASTPEQHYQHLVEPSREALAEMGIAAVPRLIEKIDTDDARERHALNNIFGRIGSPAVPALVEALDTDNLDALRNASRCLGEIGDKSAGPALVELFDHENHSVRSGAATAVGKCHDSTAVADLIGLLDDEVESVRKSAAVALGRIAHQKAAERLIEALSDAHYSVRMSAAASLVNLGEEAAEKLAVVYDRLDSIPRYLALEVWAKLNYKPVLETLLAETESSDRYMRGFAVIALAAIAPERSLIRVDEMRQSETDLFVLSMMDKATEIAELSGEEN